MKILVINAALSDLRALRAAMGPQHDVWVANGLKSAPTLYKSFKPDAVVFFTRDLNPAHPQLIRAFQNEHNCPILALAPFTHLNLINQVLDWGVDSYLNFPCDIQRVKKRLLSLMEADRMTGGIHA